MDSMLHVEDTVRSLVDSEHVVRYEVTPDYLASRTVPYQYQLSYIAWNLDGRLTRADRVSVPNLIYTAGSGWKNLGTAVDSRTGMDVPRVGQ